MTGPITRLRDIESLKAAARWSDTGRATTVTLATRLAATRADAEGYRYFCELGGSWPGEALPLALTGFFQARPGEDADAALAMLDQAAAADLGPPQYFLGLALTGLPPDQRRAACAVADLEFVLAVQDQFPPTLLRAGQHGLAAGYAVLGHDDQAAEAARKSGLGAAPADTQLMSGGFWATADGFRFTSPRILRPEPGIQVARGYDFSDLVFITTSDGVVAIDAGTTQDRVEAASGDLDLPAGGAISHVILTHGHWDHIGGAGARGRHPGDHPGRFPRRAGPPAGRAAAVPLLHRRRPGCPCGRRPGPADQRADAADRRGHRAGPVPDAGRGNQRRAAGPPPGGRRAVHRRCRHALPGAAIRRRRLPGGAARDPRLHHQLAPRLLIHGHTTQTEQFTAEAVPGLEAALAQLHGEILDRVGAARTLSDILQEASLPAVLRDHPAAVVPYLVIRDRFTERLYHWRTGDWQPAGSGLEPATPTPAGHAAALDLLAEGRQEQFAAATLIGQGDHALALRIIQPGLLRGTALHRLMEAYQLSDPFKFLLSAELADAEIGPVK